MKPSKGRIVLYTFPLGTEHNMSAAAGQERTVPAVITNVWSEDCVNLRVFTDGWQPIPSVTSVTRRDTMSEANADLAGYWEWPPRVE